MTARNRRRALMAAQGKTPGGRLPTEYQEVEWIGANVGPAINTQIYAKLSTVIKCKMQRTAYEGGSTYPALFGCASPNLAITMKSTATNVYVQFGDKTDQRINAIDLFTNLCEFDLNKTRLLINGSNVKQFNATSLTPTTTRKIAIFARYSSSNALERKSNTKCAYFKIYDGDTLECDLVPCYRKSDGVIGMYDLVAEAFRTNVGTGTFTKGADV